MHVHVSHLACVLPKDAWAAILSSRWKRRTTTTIKYGRAILYMIFTSPQYPKSLLASVLTFNELHVPFEFLSHGRGFNQSADGILANSSSAVSRGSNYSEASKLLTQLSV